MISRYPNGSDEEIANFVKMMLGAPVCKIDPSVDSAIEHYIERGKMYDVRNLKQFVYQSVLDNVRSRTRKGERVIWVELDRKIIT